MDFYKGFLFLISITGILAGSPLTEIKLFKSMKTWNDAVEFCRTKGMTLLEIRSPQKAEAVRRIKSTNIWQNNIQDFWIGLHDPNPSNKFGYSWVEGCEPQDSWGDWYTNEPLNYGSDKCIKVERDGFRWRTSPCNQAKMVMCEQAVGECYFDTVNGKSSSVVGILQSVASLEDCKTACFNMEADVNGECWAFTFTPPLLCYTHRVSNMFHYDNDGNLASLIGSTLYIKRCFQGALETLQDNSVVNNVNEPQTGCVEGESSRSESSTTITTTTTLTTNLPTTSSSALTPSSTTTSTTTATASTSYNPTTSTAITTQFTSPDSLSTISKTSTVASSADQSSTITVISDTMPAMSTEDSSITNVTPVQTVTTITTDQSETTVTTDPTATTATTDQTETIITTDPNETTVRSDTNATIATTDPTATTVTSDPVSISATTDQTATTVPTGQTATIATPDQTSTTATTDQTATTITTDPTATTASTDPNSSTNPTDPAATTVTADPSLTTFPTTPTVTIATQTTSVTNTGTSITTVTSSSSSTSNSSVSEVCGCRCHQSENLTLDERVLKIVKELLVNKKTTSKSIRAKTSAQDERTSAQNIGYSGVALIVVTGLLIVLGDADRFFSLFGKKRK